MSYNDSHTYDEAQKAKPKDASVLRMILRIIGIVGTLACFGFLFVFVLGEHELPPAPVTTEPTVSVDTTEPVIDVPAYDILSAPPADSNHTDITHKGSYTAGNALLANDVVATAGDAVLTNAQLQVYYMQEIYTYLSENSEPAFSLEHGLDVQMCSISESAMTWQQYFLQRALTTWHMYQALALDCNANNLGLNDSYYHYLNGLPEALTQTAESLGYASADAMAADLMGGGTTADNLVEYVRLYETGHSYFDRVYQNSVPTADEVKAYYLENTGFYKDISGDYVDFRHLLLIPEDDSEQAWKACLTKAQNLNYQLQKKDNEALFTRLVLAHSDDLASKNNGGLYTNVPEGMFIDEINDWCFDQKRSSGNTAIVKSSIGYHVLYFSGRRSIGESKAEMDLIAENVARLVPQAMENYPLKVYYYMIHVDNVQVSAASAFDNASILIRLCQDFPDSTYERYTSMPLYIQQDYGHVPYGGTTNTVVTHGCGISALAMLASYMTDREVSVEECAKQFFSYSSKKGTSWSLFDDAPVKLGFYSTGRTNSWDEAYEALKNGKIVVSLQHEGFFTSGGHYLVLYSLSEDDKVMMRDSNLFNYTKKFADTDYYETGFPVEMFIPANSICWIIEPKVTQIPACVRCGTEDVDALLSSLISGEYTCQKCITAMHLRMVYDSACDIDTLN